MHSSDPPQKRNPGSRPGFQTESSLNNSDWVPEGNFNEMVVGNSQKVKPNTPQVVDSYRNTTTGSGKGSGLNPDQQELLSYIPRCNHRFGLLLALHGELRIEHCEEEINELKF